MKGISSKMNSFLLRFILIGLALCPLSCRTLTHQEAKARAQQRWNTVRGRVKTQLARQQFEGHLFKESAATVFESLALDPTQTDAYVLLARANLEIGRVASAREAVEVAHRAGLDSAELVYTEGVILEQSDQVDAALEHYRRAWVLDPKCVDYLVAYAETLVAVGRSSESLALLANNVDQLDDDGTLRVLAAYVATMSGDAQLAIDQLRRAMASPAAAGTIAVKLGVLLARNARCAEALAILRPVIEQPGEFVVQGAVRRAVAACYLDTGAAGKAMQTLLAYSVEHPEDASAKLLLAKAALAAGDIHTALDSIEAAEYHDASHPEVKLVRAVVEWKSGRLESAAGTLRALLAMQPDDADAHCLLAEILLVQYRPEAARAHFRQALEADPTCVWATAGLASMEQPAEDS